MKKNPPTICSIQMKSPVGWLTLEMSEKGLRRIDWNKPARLVHFNPTDLSSKGKKQLDRVARWLTGYFEGKKTSAATISLDLEGTEFQKKVWMALLDIPYGQTRSYGEIAEIVGCKAARPVGGAVGANPIPVLIPCHRVISKSGTLGGFSGGLSKKVKLLEIEGWSVATKPVSFDSKLEQK